MAHPGADYDPYDGIVSNPNKKKNPLVLVGACLKRWTQAADDRGRACRDARDSGDLDLDLNLFLLLRTLALTKTKRRHGSHRGSPHCGAGRVPAGKNVSLKQREREKKNIFSPFFSLPDFSTSTSRNAKKKSSQGNQKVSQRMMRARVAFQGLTVATMLASSMFVLKEKTVAAEAEEAAAAAAKK
jgi:hypothetical protein